MEDNRLRVERIKRTISEQIDYEEYLSYNNLCANVLEEIDNATKELEVKMFIEGLDATDLKSIESYLKGIYTIDYSIKSTISSHICTQCKEKRYYDEIKYQKYLLRCAGEIGIKLKKLQTVLKKSLGKYDKKSFVKDNSSLLHLVSTNNHSNKHIRKVSDDSYFYNCQFHIERRPSMQVKNNKNRLFCYGCGSDLNVFEYLMIIEKVNFEDAFCLLAEINKINVAGNPFKSSDEIVKKYTSYEALRRYENRVLAGERRAISKNRTLNNYLALEKYNREKATIARIRKNEYIEIPEYEKQKRLILTIPTFTE